jgi:MFS family permease
MHGIFSTSCLIGEDVREASIMGFRERIKDFLGINTSIISMLIMVILIGLGERMAERFLPLYLVAVGGTVFVVGFMNAMQNFLGAIYSFPGGYLSDKLGYKRSLMLFTVIALFGYAIVIIFPYWQAVIIGCIFFIAWSAISLPAVMSLVANAVSKEKRTMGVTLHSLVRRIPMALGPVIGGILIGLYGEVKGIKIAFCIAFVVGVISLLVEYYFIEDSGEKKEAHLHVGQIFSSFNPSLYLLPELLFKQRSETDHVGRGAFYVWILSDFHQFFRCECLPTHLLSPHKIASMQIKPFCVHVQGFRCFSNLFSCPQYGSLHFLLSILWGIF